MADLSQITSLFTTDPEEFIALKRRVMGDTLPNEPLDAIYCVGGTVDTQMQSLSMGAARWFGGRAERIGVLRGSTDHGYAGFDFCRDWLMSECGVWRSAIVAVDILPEDGDKVNTYTEMKGLITHALVMGWRTLIVCAPFFHQIRASSTLISQLNITNPELLIFNQPANPPKINETMRHSQGVVQGDVLELLISELGRLFLYHNMGHIRSCKELLGYYDYRDHQYPLVHGPIC